MSFHKSLYITTEICASSNDCEILLIGKSTNLNILNHIYIELYFKNLIRRRFIIFHMEGPASDNILDLSADMENLTGLGQRAVNTEHGRFKYS